MTFRIPDFVQETTVTTGTGTITLGGAAKVGNVTFRSFVARAGAGNTVAYSIYAGNAFELGIGTLASGANDTLTRDTVLASSNGGSLVNFGAGTKNVACLPSGLLMEALLDPSQTGLPERTGVTAWTYRALSTLGRTLLNLADAAAGRTALGLGGISVYGLDANGGLEASSNNVRLKLDGSTLARGTNGAKVTDRGIGLGQIADQTRGSLLTWVASNLASALAPGTLGQFLKSNGPGANLSWADVLFQKSYDSGNLSYTAGGTIALTNHSLGALPRWAEARLVCIDAGGEAGWAQNQEFTVSDVAHVNGTGWFGVQVRRSATQIGAQVAAAGIMGLDATGNGVVLTPSKWRLRLLAWV